MPGPYRGERGISKINKVNLVATDILWERGLLPELASPENEEAPASEQDARAGADGTQQ